MPTLDGRKRKTGRKVIATDQDIDTDKLRKRNNKSSQITMFEKMQCKSHNFP